MNNIIEKIQSDIEGLTNAQANDYINWLDSIIIKLAD